MKQTNPPDDREPGTAGSEEEQQQDSQRLASPARRRFAKLGLGASAAIVTLASRPALGQGVCQTPSGFQSGNVSQPGTPIVCSGRTPGFWQAPNKNWPSPYLAGTCTNTKNLSSNYILDWTGGTAFAKVGTAGVFTCSNNSRTKNYLSVKVGTTTIKPSLMQVLLMGGTLDAYQLGAHITAALLNARMGWTVGVLSVSDVINIWNEYNSKGYYEPTAGVKWYPADIVAYLQSTMTV